MPIRLTDRFIDSRTPDPDKSLIFFDSEVSGFAVRLYPSGRRTFIFDWRDGAGKQRRTTLGQRPVWATAKARIHASKMRLKADVGEVVTPRKSEKVAALLATWQASVAVTRRPGTVKAYLRLADIHILPSFAGFDPKALTRNVIELWHGEIAQETPIEANRALSTLSVFLTWLKNDKRVDSNEATGIRRCPENHRHVFLTAEEIVAAHAVLDTNNDRSSALALKLVLLTGARIGEVLNLESGQIQVDGNRRAWIKPASTTKQKKLHILPLSVDAVAVAQQLLQLGLPNYDGVRSVWKLTKKIINREDVRIHDLRHSRASSLARNGASLPQIGKLLGHASPNTTNRYVHLIADDLVDLVERTA